MNTLKTTLLLGGLTLLLVLGGGALGGEQGMVFAFFMALLMNFGVYFFSDRLVLSMYGAREIGEAEAPRLYSTVRELARRAGMPMPKVYVINGEQPNAFATGRNPQHAAVAVTQGITRILDEEELAGVLAHEVAHIKNRDILIGTVAATIAGALSMLANMAQWNMMFGGHRDDERQGGHPALAILMMIIAPIAAMLIQMAISRTREYQADRTGAELIGSGVPLANALEKLQAAARAIPMNAEPATAHMFIVSPLAGKDFASLFSTHPPIEKRVALLRSLQPV